MIIQNYYVDDRKNMRSLFHPIHFIRITNFSCSGHSKQLYTATHMWNQIENLTESDSIISYQIQNKQEAKYDERFEIRDA